MSGEGLGSVVEVVGSNLARAKLFTTSFGSVDLLYPSVFICCVNLIYVFVCNDVCEIFLHF